VAPRLARSRCLEKALRASAAAYSVMVAWLLAALVSMASAASVAPA
jgi:hypothetical protein